MECFNSKYIIQKIFYFMNPKRIFKIAKYNKNLQNKLDLNINDFMEFSGRYIEYYEKGKGIEYESLFDKVIFEGEYLNGERKKGKEYDNEGIVLYEGEFSNGKRNGKGKEHYHKAYLKFEGEYLNGERWNGNAEEYRDFHFKRPIFKGEYKNGKKWNGKGYDLDNNIVYELKEGKGYVKEYNEYGLLSFEGEYLNGEKNGKAKEYYERGDLAFEGEYKDGKKWNGKGYDNKNSVIYELNNGKGKFKIYDYYNDRIFIEGEYINGEINGKGKEYNNGILIFEGEYLNGKKIKGKEYYLNGKLEFEGEYLNGKKNGKGKEYDNDNNLKFEGEYRNGKKYIGKEYIKGKFENVIEYKNYKKWNGIGYDENGNILFNLINGNGIIKEFDENTGELKFEGEYLNGKRNGKGKEYYRSDKLKFEGEYLNGKRNGKGKNYNFDGKLEFEGEYLHGKY